jgi:hypothetical protein
MGFNWAFKGLDIMNMSLFLRLLSGMQITSFVCCSTLSSVASLATPYSFTFSHKWHNVWDTVIEHKTRVVIFSTTFV